MRILPINRGYANNNLHSQNNRQSNSKVAFNGRTKFFAFTDIHQNAEKHCKMVYEILKKSDNRQSVILDNGDIFKGLFPKYTLMHTYVRAKKIHPELEVVYNMGNNDPGFMEKDRHLFARYLEILHKHGVKTISCNIVDETTGQRPKGLQPYTIVERDGDKLLYVGFVVNKLKQKFAGMTTVDPIKALEDIAPTLKEAIKKNDCKGLVMMVHDTEDVAQQLNSKAQELGLKPEFILGGHVHHPYYSESEKIIYPEPFGKSMLSFDLNIDKDAHKLSTPQEILSDDCELGIYKNLIEKSKEKEKFNEKVAKSVTDLKFRYQDEYNMEYSQLGTMYADGIKGLTKSDVGFVPRSWMYDTLPKKEGYITKLDILLSCPQPYRHIVQVKMTPDELKSFYQHDIDKKAKLFEASQNFGVTLDKDNKIKQIHLNGKPLFNADGTAVTPDRIISIAIDAHTAESIACEQQELDYKMYDGIVYGLQQLEAIYTPNYTYPTAKLTYLT